MRWMPDSVPGQSQRRMEAELNQSVRCFQPTATTKSHNQLRLRSSQSHPIFDFLDASQRNPRLAKCGSRILLAILVCTCSRLRTEVFCHELFQSRLRIGAEREGGRS